MKYLFNPPVDGSVLTLADETIRKGQIVELPDAVAARLLAKAPPYIVAVDPPVEAKPAARKKPAAKPPEAVPPVGEPESEPEGEGEGA